MKFCWVWGILVGIVLALLAVYPQVRLNEKRGDNFAGAFATCDLDEMAYASYVQALIDGRPRKNDPYTGRDQSSEERQTESLFSIQFLPAYLAAVPAKIFGLSAVQMMPVVSVVSAFLTALALFWLISLLADDAGIAAAGTLVVMTGGAMISGIGAISGFFEGGFAYPFFPYMRRPIPSLAFPFLFAFLACVYKGLTSEKWRWIFAALSVACFSALVFSYFYLWTSAAAVLGGFAIITLVSSSENKRRDLIFLISTGAICVVPLMLYGVMLLDRNPLADKAQLLVLTRTPDLFRPIETIGFFVIAAVIVGVWVRIFDDRRKASLITACALAPIIVFNQQILTGRSLQPFHYEFYSVNYVVLFAVVMVAAFVWKKYLDGSVSHVLAAIVAVIAIGWGGYEAYATTRVWDEINAQRDDAMPVNLRLRELAENDIATARKTTTLNLDALQGDGQPTVAPQPVLWARHQNTFAGITTWEENKLRYYQLLYFADLNADSLRAGLTGCQDIEACMALFGWDRFNARLSANARPLTIGEINEEVARFDEFVKNFSAADAATFELKFLVVNNAANNKLENVDRWFERDGGEVRGSYTIYKLRLK